MKRYNFALIAVLLVLFITGTVQAGGLFDINNLTAKGRGLNLVKSGQYDKALEELVPIAHRDDIEIKEGLIECYLHTGKDKTAYEMALKFKDDANQADRIARIYLNSLNSCNNMPVCSKRIWTAESFAKNNETKKAVGIWANTYRLKVPGMCGQNLTKLAVLRLGHGPVLGFEVEKLKGNKVKIIFHNNQPIKIADLKTGTRITYLQVSNPEKVKEYNPEKNISGNIVLNFTFKEGKDRPLMLQGGKGEFAIIQSKEIFSQLI